MLPPPVVLSLRVFGFPEGYRRCFGAPRHSIEGHQELVDTLVVGAFNARVHVWTESSLTQPNVATLGVVFAMRCSVLWQAIGHFWARPGVYDGDMKSLLIDCMAGKVGAWHDVESRGSYGQGWGQKRMAIFNWRLHWSQGGLKLRADPKLAEDVVKGIGTWASTRSRRPGSVGLGRNGAMDDDGGEEMSSAEAKRYRTLAARMQVFRASIAWTCITVRKWLVGG